MTGVGQTEKNSLRAMLSAVLPTSDIRPSAGPDAIGLVVRPMAQAQHRHGLPSAPRRIRSPSPILTLMTNACRTERRGD
jgi:hypothetical protein